MTTRPRQHVLEEISNRAFRNALPPEWVIRDQHPDYGLDCQIQPFRDGNATSLLFFAQLKSTDTISADAKEASFAFDCPRLRYYLQLTLPVMLVVHDAQNARTYFEWVHKIDVLHGREGTRDLQTQQTMTLRLSRRLDEVSGVQILGELEQYYRSTGQLHPRLAPLRIRVEVTQLDQKAGRAIVDDLISWAAQTNGAVLIQRDAKDASVTFKADTAEIELWYLNTRLSLKAAANTSFEPSALQLSARFALFSLTIAAGMPRVAAELILRLISTADRETIESLLAGPGQAFIAQLVAQAGMESEVLDVAEKLMADGEPRFAAVLSPAVVLGRNTSGLVQRYRRILKSVASDARVGDSFRGIVHYNLGNSLRNDGLHDEAIRQYWRAAQLVPGYLMREYWWRESAGSLFLSGRRRLSLVYYEQARMLDPDGIANVLSADVLFFLGRFKEASERFAVYLGRVKAPDPAFVLKHWFSLQQRARQRRLESRALSEAKAAYGLTIDQQLAPLERAIDDDPLCDFAYYNWAWLRAKDARKSAWRFWLAAAVVSGEWDPVVWANALASLYSDLREERPEEQKLEQSMLFLSTLFQANRLHGERFFEEVHRNVSAPDGGSVEPFAKFLRNSLVRATQIFEEFHVENVIRMGPVSE